MVGQSHNLPEWRELAASPASQKSCQDGSQLQSFQHADLRHRREARCMQVYPINFHRSAGNLHTRGLILPLSKRRMFRMKHLSLGLISIT